jgi:hypothetical protein
MRNRDLMILDDDDLGIGRTKCSLRKGRRWYEVERWGRGRKPGKAGCWD